MNGTQWKRLGWVGLLLLGMAMPLQAVPPAVPTRQATQLEQQGRQQYQQGQWEAAIQSWRLALVLYQQQQNPLAERVLEQLGLAHYDAGRYAAAADYYQQQLAAAQQRGDRRSAANALGNLGSTYRILGQYAKALDATEQSLQLRRHLRDRRGEGQTLANLGNLQTDLGNYEQAEQRYEQSLQIAAALGDRRNVTITLNSLGALQAAQGEYRQARQFYERSLTAAEAIGFQAAAADALSNLGAIDQIERKFEASIRTYQKTLAIAEAADDARLRVAALGGLGLGYSGLQQYETALDYHQQSVTLAQQVRDRKLESLALTNLGDTQWQLGQLQQAEATIRAALERLESLRLGLADADRVSILDTQLHSYQILQQILVAQQRPELALEIAERSRARAFVVLLARRLAEADSEPTVTPATEPLPTLADIRRIAAEQNATLVEYAIVPDDRFVTQGKQKGKDRELFIWVVSPTGQVAFRRVDLRSLPMPLADLVQASRCLNRTFACEVLAQSVRRGGLGVVGIPSSDRESLFRPHPQGGAAPPLPSGATPQPALRALHQLLIAPIADLLPRDPEARVVMVPQESLFLLPFPALQSAQGTDLVEQHTLLTAPSIQVLDLTRQQRQARGVAPAALALVVGNPVMPTVSLAPGQAPEPLAPLPGAEQEARQIANLLQTQAVIGAAATETWLKHHLPQARLVHLATHGLLEYGTGQRWAAIQGQEIPGAIALTPSATEDGLLTASEIFALRLQADLVVLSACDTGQGRITGDGVVGLSRSFISAGAPSVIVSLWSVPDGPTAQLMTQFYAAWLRDRDKAQALRQAMLATRRTHPNPLDWAAFTLIGEAE